MAQNDTTPLIDKQRQEALCAAFDLDNGAWDEIRQLAMQTARPQAPYEEMERVAAHNDVDAPQRAALLRGLRDPHWRRLIVIGVGNSHFLAGIVRRWPDFIPQLMDAPFPPDPDQLRRDILEDVLATKDRAEAEKRLRIHKHRLFFAVGARELAGHILLEQTTETLSLLAEICLEACYQWLRRDLAAIHGEPMSRQEDGSEAPSRFVILGMGKFGARELNFSSDIDLIYLHDVNDGQTTGPRQIAIKQFFIKLGRELMKMMHTPSAEGFVFRTDLRLRPEGESGDLSIPLLSAETYYESWGQTWERAAMIKARPVAGDIAMGEAFLTSLRPFVYRRYLDYSALESIREMKHKIDRKVNNAEGYGRNVKLGFGGIREIEFFAQSQQLIHGGKIPELRTRETITALRLLREHGFLDYERCETLCANYRFLRTVEHRIQIEREQQTHNLPTDDDTQEWEALSRRMGMDLATFRAKLDSVRKQVHGIYQELFFGGHESAEEAALGERAEELMRCNIDSPRCDELLIAAGVEDLAAGRDFLTLLREGPRRSALTETDQLWFDKLAPRVLDAVLDAADPDLAITHAAEFLEQLIFHPHYLALLVESPGVLNLLIPIFGASPLLSRFFIRTPALMDRLVSQEFLAGYQGQSRLRQELTGMLTQVDDAETRHELIRSFKNTEVLRLGIRDLGGLADLSETMAGLSAIATISLEQVFNDAWRELAERHGAPMMTNADGERVRARFAILAMGKLGGDELNYSSDLDLIFLHTSSGEQSWTDGERSVSNNQFFAKLGQRIIHGITALTRGGRLYELDMRLRPSGNSGPIVSAWDSFKQYQLNEAWTWEHQALTRARVVVGDADTARLVGQFIHDVIAQPRDLATLRDDVHAMRERIYQEKKPPESVIDIKQARGGVVDVEFLIQYLILGHAHTHPNVIHRNASRALTAIYRAGLLDQTEWESLENAYRFFRLIENRLRLLHDRSENRIARDDARVQARLARLCNLEDGQEVITLLEAHMARVRPLYEKHLLPAQ
ncbi:bifunctional [glutamate--ammonia ligase]-adenylyl-L-tyrosine phosphorylase/[glutamate--ammonia-ligase] adenylyltransferase [Magnetofaba australis]|uniref:Bifunctional glutamine synthetase adenylyltransferase/adenylyl-removing enzyme n=1 Tax=Magnetofaba australis IT-1 TaxID=1434232 RepID=A0A1Y2K6R4_9PROT|nr:bifunctional [glutamate--ammonia ligase]-adenylyl-L-tyrosine phosphorylase/[glutamate--ammonia-ligase] adenylyltransferase [Magnetofaba australis]OSM05230.1 putative (glutamate--ammonia-ligase) adenylyltransferase [Magnetofaba australis IT-1]